MTDNTGTLVRSHEFFGSIVEGFRRRLALILLVASFVWLPGPVSALQVDEPSSAEEYAGHPEARGTILVTAEAPPTEFNGPLFLVIIGLGLPVVALYAIFSGRCPGCKKLWALRSTGETEIAEVTLQLFVCKHCGQRLWKNVRLE